MNKEKTLTAQGMRELSEPMYQQIHGEKEKIQNEKDEEAFVELIGLIRDVAQAGGRSLDLYKTKNFGWHGKMNENIQNKFIELGYIFSEHHIPHVETCPNGVINW